MTWRIIRALARERGLRPARERKTERLYTDSFAENSSFPFGAGVDGYLSTVKSVC